MRALVLFTVFVLGIGAGAAAMFLIGPNKAADLLERPVIKMQSANIRAKADEIERLKRQVEQNSTLATNYFNRCENDRNTIEKLSAEVSNMKGFCKSPISND